uniref:diphthine methyl ester synthase n=1 Tax=Gadus morhua TaxID=8049 RepID=A0A8C5BF80_GADMO
MLYLVGLGLGDAKDITVKGLEVVRRCSRVYLEAYTSVLTVGKEALEEFYGRELILADRDLVELEAEEILKEADTSDVAFLVVGDPFGATTHSDLVLRAVHAGISYRVVHNASIMNAVGCCGLQLYSFGETVSIVFWDDDWKPESFYDKIKKNRSMGLHSLCLLGETRGWTSGWTSRGRKVYEPPRFMSVSQAAGQLVVSTGLTEDTLCVGVARVGAEDQVIRTATLRQLGSCDLGPPLHSLVVTGRLHPLEVDMLRLSAAPDALAHLEVEDSSTS